MRPAKLMKSILIAAVVSAFSVGVLEAAAPVVVAKNAMFCTFHVSSCATTECSDICAAFNPQSIPMCSQGVCCNCLF